MHWVEQPIPPPPLITQLWKQVQAELQAVSLEQSTCSGQHFDAIQERHACGGEVQATEVPPHTPLVHLPVQHSH